MTLLTVKHKIDGLLRGSLYPLGLSVVVALASMSCSNRDEEEPGGSRGGVGYMALTTRVQGTAPSLNTDTQDKEDKVDNLRLIAFEHASGKAVYNKKHPIADFTNYNVKIPMRTGEYDFCFVANETTAMTPALEKVAFKDGLYYDDLLTKISYEGVNNKPELFLMTAEVTKTVNANNTENNPLHVDVNLIRCLAKVDLNMRYKDGMTEDEKEATKGLHLARVIFKNLPKTYSLFPPKAPYAGDLKDTEDYLGIADAQYSDNGVNPVLQKSVYIPEYLRATGALEDTKSSIEVHYEKHGIDRVKNVDIDHQNFSQANDTYKPAIAALLSTKSIVRNTSYALSGNLKGWVEESITFNWEILPWNLIKSFKEFAAVIVNPTIDTTQPHLEVGGENQNELLWHSGGTEGLKLKFNIEAPAGGVWRFTITNRNDFELKGKMEQSGLETLTGIAGSGPIELTITPLKTWTGQTRSTELYLTVNGVEVQIVPEYIKKGIDPGPTKRFMITQAN